MRSEPIRLLSVGETSFARHVRAATVPIVVVFEASQCDASRALLPILARLAAQFGDRALALRVNVDRAPLLAEQYGVTATPTMLVLHDGEELTRVVGFAPEALVRRLFAQVFAGELPPGRLWSPVEQEFEDAVIIPLLESWGWAYQRQVTCPSSPRAPARRGRVDLLIYADDPVTPLTLFENKRLIASRAALQRAVVQAHGYAAAFALGSFVVAAPVGMWIYRLDGERVGLVQSFTSLEIAAAPEIVQQALRWL
jgi:thioredoxin 2